MHGERPQVVTISRAVVFIGGFVSGGLAMFFGTLYLAQRASPVWVKEEEIGSLYQLETEAKARFKEGNIQEALEKIAAASVFREMRSRTSSYREWSYTFPTISLYLAFAGLAPQQFVDSGKPDKVVLMYRCVEIFLLSEQKST